jgi:hypothetical protein
MANPVRWWPRSPATGATIAFLLVAVACGSSNCSSPCGGGLFESCIQNDPAAMQQALERREAKLAYPGSRLVNQAATGVKGVNTTTVTQARVTRIFELPSEATFGQVVAYYDGELTAVGWRQAPELATPARPAGTLKPDSFVRWIRMYDRGGDLLILTSAGLPAGRYRAQLTVDGVDSNRNDNDSAYVVSSLDSPDPRFEIPRTKASPST